MLYWLFATVLTVSQLFFSKNFIRSMMDQQVSAPDQVWNRLLFAWVGFFVFMGILNLYVAFNYPTDTWVSFKLFGGIGLMLLFVLGQAFVLAPHMKEKSDE